MKVCRYIVMQDTSVKKHYLTMQDSVFSIEYIRYSVNIARGVPDIGNVIVNIVPLFTSLFTSIVP